MQKIKLSLRKYAYAHTHKYIYMNKTNKGNNFFDTNSVRYYYYYCSKIKD